MRTAGQELTLSSALSDPLIRTVMAADKVDPVRFEAMLRTVAREIGAGSQPRKPLRVTRFSIRTRAGRRSRHSYPRRKG